MVAINTMMSGSSATQLLNPKLIAPYPQSAEPNLLVGAGGEVQTFLGEEITRLSHLTILETDSTLEGAFTANLNDSTPGLNVTYSTKAHWLLRTSIALFLIGMITLLTGLSFDMPFITSCAPLFVGLSAFVLASCIRQTRDDYEHVSRD